MNQETKSPDHFVGLDDEAGVVEVLKTSVFGPWQVVNNLTRLRPSRRAGPQVIEILRAHHAEWRRIHADT